MQGDLEALKPMVSPAVLEAFRRATAPVRVRVRACCPKQYGKPSHGTARWTSMARSDAAPHDKRCVNLVATHVICNALLYSRLHCNGLHQCSPVGWLSVAQCAILHTPRLRNMRHICPHSTCWETRGIAY